MTTIYDVAKRAGVSPATVSRVLNGYSDVSEKTRARIAQIVAEMDYRPNTYARGLATKRSMSIGVFFQDLEDKANAGFRHPFFNDVIAAFHDVVGHQGYDLVFFSNESSDRNDPFDTRATHRNVDGLLLLAISREHVGLRSITASQIPCMSVDLDLLGPRAGYVVSENVEGAIRVVDFLVENGHRDIAFVGDRWGTRPGHDRLVGYQRGLEKHRLPFRPEWILEGDFGETSGYEAAMQLISGRERPTSIFCAGDMMAVGAMKAVHDCGLSVGDDVSIVGFDDITLARYVTPSLTTVRQQRDRMGAEAANALLSLIEDPRKPPPMITIDTMLVVRESVKAPRKTLTVG